MTDDAPHGTFLDEYRDALAIADEVVGSPAAASQGGPLTHDQLWRLVDSDDLSEGVRARLVALVGQAGGVTEPVVAAARAEVEKASATIRLRRTMLQAPMFDSIRAEAEGMIEAELAQLAAIIPELLEAQRAAAEQQQVIADTMTEVHKIQMEGAMRRQAIRDEISLDQSSQHDDHMKTLRAQSDARHKAFLDSIRGSRY